MWKCVSKEEGEGVYMIATQVIIVKQREDTQTPAQRICRKETRFIQYQQKYGHDCVCMEKKREWRAWM